MININRFSIKIGGESGQGINVAGEILSKAIKYVGYKTFGYREYPSLIKGGYASRQIDFSDSYINSPSKKCDILISLSRMALHKYLLGLNKEGILIHQVPMLDFDKNEKEHIKKNKIRHFYIDAVKISEALGGGRIASNVVLAGCAWKVLGFDKRMLEKTVEKIFADKPKFIEIDKKCVNAGYSFEFKPGVGIKIPFRKNKNWTDSLIISGNESTALGALAAGVRAYYSYPMTPTSAVHDYLSNTYHKTKILIKQAEDEITAIQMTLGSMFMGTRALIATSGGGYDLMTETISLAGITETPLVCILGQRPGPATGLPTWTAAGDLNLALYSSHGEFPRCVIALSDAVSSFSLIQKAFNIAEQFQIPVIILTEKQVAESLFNVKNFPKPIKIKRFLANKEQLKNLKSSDRYGVTKSGVSTRWLPGQTDQCFLANSDEHSPDGTSTEEAEIVKAMFEKRMKKTESLLVKLPDPVIYGPERADVSFVGWGSVKNTVLDVMNILKFSKNKLKVNYLHFDYVYPLKTEVLKKFLLRNKNVVLMENNYQGQLGNLIKQNIGFDFRKEFSKYDGRPFFIEDLLEFLKVQ